jgi:hypothetical protein
MTTNNVTNTPELTLNGQLIIGSTGATPVAATLTQGAGITITNAAGSITIAASGTELTWTTVASSSQALAVNNGYIVNNGASLCTLTLPSTAAVGSIIAIIGLSASTGLWKIAQNASQLINFGSSVTTTGTGGSIASTLVNDNIYIICTVTNTTWAVVSAVGNQTVT